MTTIKGTAWSVTINNPTKADEDNIALARQHGYKVEGQKEKGESGTEHYQLMVKTPHVRFSAVKKAFPRAHIEVAKNVAALTKYVVKDETRVGSLPMGQELYPSLQTVWDMFYTWTPMEWKEAKKKKEDEWLELFDAFCADQIEQGYVLETIAVNPQVRSAVKKFGYAIWTRSKTRLFTARHPDGQTDEKDVAVDTITDTDGIQAQDEGGSTRACSAEEEGSEEEGSGTGSG